MPAGTFEFDPASDIQRIQSEGISFDRAVNRWVPADWNHLSPDGQHYAWLGADLNVVDVNTNADKVIHLPQIDGVWVIIDFNQQGIFLTDTAGEVAPTQVGLWRVNPESGAVSRLDSTQTWSMVDSTSAWGVKVGDSDMKLERLDLNGGAVTTELTVSFHRTQQPGDRAVELVALDLEGRPLVLIRDWQRPGVWRMALLEALDTLLDVTLPQSWLNWPPLDNGDPWEFGRDLVGYRLSQGIWMIGGLGSSTFPGVAYLGPDNVIHQVSTAPSQVFEIAGGCH